MKKYLNKKNFGIMIIAIFIFFSIFKYMKGKSLFDTIVEYTNNIHSINADVVSADTDDILFSENQYIKASYVNYEQIDDEYYIGKKFNSQDLYIYNIRTREEVLYEKISEKNIVSNIITNRNYVIWLETFDNKDDNATKQWKISAKNFDTNEVFIIDNGQFKKDINDNRIIFPDGFDLNGKNIVYRKYDLRYEQKNNIKAQQTVSKIMLFDLETKILDEINTSNDISLDLLYQPMIDGDNVIWQHVTIKNEYETYNTDVYRYNISTKQTKKIFSHIKINDIDIKGNSVVIATENPNEINILNLNNSNNTILFYKGSKVEKFAKTSNDSLDIKKVKFINSNYIMIDTVNKNEHKNFIYNISDEKILNFDEYFNKNEKIEIFLESDSYRLVSNLGFVALFDGKETYINEDMINKNGDLILEYMEKYDIDIYYKINKYILK